MTLGELAHFQPEHLVEQGIPEISDISIAQRVIAHAKDRASKPVTWFGMFQIAAGIVPYVPAVINFLTPAAPAAAAAATAAAGVAGAGAAAPLAAAAIAATPVAAAGMAAVACARTAFCMASNGPASYCKVWQSPAVCHGNNLPC